MKNNFTVTPVMLIKVMLIINTIRNELLKVSLILLQKL